MADITTNTDTLLEKIGSLEEKNRRLYHEAQGARADRALEEAIIDRLARRVQYSEAALKGLEEERDELAAKVERLKLELSGVRAPLTESYRRRTEAEGAVNDLVERLTESERNLEATAMHYESLQQERDDALRSLEAVTQDRDNILKVLEGVRERADKAEWKAARLGSDLASVKKLKDAAHTKATALRTDYNTVVAETEDLGRVVGKLRSELTDVVLELERVEARRKVWRELATKLYRERGRVRRRGDIWRDTVSELLDELEVKSEYLEATSQTLFRERREGPHFGAPCTGLGEDAKYWRSQPEISTISPAGAAFAGVGAIPEITLDEVMREIHEADPGSYIIWGDKYWGANA